MRKTFKVNFPEKFRNKVLEDFLRNYKQIKSGQDFFQMLGSFLTESELVMVEKRIIIKALLKKKFSIREISRIVQVQPKTVIFVKKGLKKAAYKKEKVEEMGFWEDLLYDLFAKKSEGIFPKYQGKRRGIY